jgi:hypothetical protein
MGMLAKPAKCCTHQKGSHGVGEPYLLELVATLDPSDEEVTDALHRLCSIAEASSRRVEEVLVILWIVGKRKLENVKMDQQEERQW